MAVLHGVTEKTFVKELFDTYKELWLVKNIEQYDTLINKPKITFFDNDHKIQTNEIDKRLIEKFDSKFISDNEALFNGDFDIYVINIFDFGEQDMCPKFEKEILEDDCKEVISNVFDNLHNSDIVSSEAINLNHRFKDSKLIYFYQAIENAFENLTNVKYNKPANLKKEMRRTIWDDLDKFVQFYSSGLFGKQKITNLSQIFDYFDKIMLNYKKIIEE